MCREVLNGLADRHLFINVSSKAAIFIVLLWGKFYLSFKYNGSDVDTVENLRIYFTM